MPGNPALIEFISKRIAAHGPVTFRWFMEQALYHPECGYYSSGKAAIGRRGDYFTNVSVGAIFGKLLAAQFHEMWKRMQKPVPFTIVEQGSNNGAFAHDVLSALEKAAPDFFDALRYEIVEPFAVLRERQRKTLASFSNASWRESLAELNPFLGVHFSNELLDAMPVHLVKFSDGDWQERYVNERFEFIDGALSTKELKQKLEQIPCIENYETEVNLAALEWIGDVAAKLERGYLITIDYGWPREIFYSPERTRGTLACCANHRRNDDPFLNIGETDITAHVDFTSLAERAEMCGLEIAGFTDQHHFMVGLGRHEFPDTGASLSADRQKQIRAFQTLMHPNLMGLSFQALALQKNVPAGEPLRGFQFAGNPRTALGFTSPAFR